MRSGLKKNKMQQNILRWIDVIKFARYGNPEPTQKIIKTEKESISQ